MPVARLLVAARASIDATSKVSTCVSSDTTNVNLVLQILPA